ncbi:MAG TPA: phosphomannomutase/phosphoglucomutase [Sphingomonas sp.]|jgi:phosphomannomutase|uniref:phosphoglucomutase/phosphomannomutase PgmG n=1 Tax=Sphingomonas sp. TaxID=28214 RepID=UPI002EDA3374
MPHRFDPAILRDYDVRGVVGRGLGPADAVAIGRSFGTVVRRAGGTRIAVCYDGRTHSPMLEEALVTGLTATGIDVVRIGLGPTPMLYFAETALEVDAGIMVTGSHNPADHNGFKLVLHHRPFFGADITRLGETAAAGDWDDGDGRVDNADIADLYLDRLLQDHDAGALRIGWDTGNGAAGPLVDRLTALLPGTHLTLYTSVDGRFPNHHPDPTIPANLAALRDLVMAQALDFGIAFDGDGDRIGAVDGHGRIVPADQLLAILAEPVLAAHPGATIIGDVKMSQALFDRVAALGGTPVMGKAGHAPMKMLLAETGALLAGEMSGHLFFADRYPGYDDALYAALRLIDAVHRSGRTLAELVDELPTLANTPELRFPCPDDRKFAVVAAITATLQAAAIPIDTTDGIRRTGADGWWLLRASNTEPLLVARAEGRDAAALDRLIADLNGHLTASGIAPLRLQTADTA